MSLWGCLRSVAIGRRLGPALGDYSALRTGICIIVRWGTVDAPSPASAASTLRVYLHACR